MLPVNNLVFDSTISAGGTWRNISNLTALSIMLTGVESNTWIEASNQPRNDVQTVAFASDFPDAGSWPLPTPDWNVGDVTTPVWVSPNDVNSNGGDEYSTFNPPLGSGGGSISAVVHGTGVASGGLGFYLMGDPLDANFNTTIGYWLFLDSGGVSFQKFGPGGGPVQDFVVGGPAYVFPSGDHKFELRWAPVGTTNVVSVYIDDVLTYSGIDTAPPVDPPQYAVFEPYESGGGDIDVGSLVVTSFVSSGPATGIDVSGDLSAPSSMSEIAVIVDIGNQTALWSPSCLVWNWIRVCKNATVPALETKAFLFGQNG